MPSNLIFQLIKKNAVVRSGIVACSLPPKSHCHLRNGYSYSTANTAHAVQDQEQNLSQGTGEKKMSRAMLSYLERAREHEAFIRTEKENFQIGKRHLANMMGEDPEHFTQADVDRAIEYLFPSGLFEKKARPMMKPPEEIFPPRKAAEFDESGRPFHSMFYTVSPAYYKTLYDIVEQIQGLNAFEDEMIKKNVTPDPDNVLDLHTSDWISHRDLEKKLGEKLRDWEYEYFLSTFERLVLHPYAYQARQFVMEYRIPRASFTSSLTIPELQFDSDGRPFITVKGCYRKKARGIVTLRGNGSGIITVNGQSLIHYFPLASNREQVIFPLHFAGLLDKIDVEATVTGGGTTGQSGAIRWGIAWGLRCFVDLKTMEAMRLAGLLTRDWRMRERKKPGQEGARRKFTWKAR
ncbi:hypothetical protein QAD02_014495 [Eretmocerus hayati]|uniref:Uncharacterized protein n=1 Tax=Eretmocerus hayati TaxID=131215 RepID=A0ACC2P6H7_9HYME|nr:hypothetical protein QAD02_014495 [Eretmocerus hayati]